ncbi:hypothetical protein KUTeg_009710 [Tegillarca granosa]|uniref:C-type lectin domain-containing protein n=1 Tax=Tegillarca granosa TaxID=220873 RepID=A0ABQ9F4Q1_TEGGR|nr:hypothetical protein KUTeg_009710 [Tegillarca granosa]
MHLPIVETDEEMHFIDSIIRNDNHDIWLDGTDIAVEGYGGVWLDVWLDGTDIAVEGYWVWNTTGKLIEHTMWNTNQPDNYFYAHSENCLEYGPDYNYKWNDAPCDRHLSVLCEWRYILKQLFCNVKDNEKDCATGWKTEGFRMFCNVNAQTNWFEAKALCQKLYSHLPFVDSAEKQMLIARMTGSNEIWLDGTEEGHKGIWKWSSTGQTIRPIYPQA